MRNSFNEYYRPTKDEFSQLWEDCLFVLDANVLLNIYRYTPNTRNELIDILNIISNRLWVPYQAALEYQQNRLNVINQQSSAYSKIQDTLEVQKNNLINELKSYSRHPFIHVNEFIDIVDKSFIEIEKKLNDGKTSHPNLLDNDELRETLTDLLEGKVGSACPQEKLDKIYKIGKKRFDYKVPPGYNDEKKGDLKQFGDLILWLQIIDHAKSIDNPIIFVTDDRKEDWWRKFNGKIVGPRPELIKEMSNEANKNFYMYQTEQFMFYAREYLKSSVDQKSIDEVNDIRKHDEKIITAETMLLKDTIKSIVENEEERRAIQLTLDGKPIPKKISDMEFIFQKIAHMEQLLHDVHLRKEMDKCDE